MGQQESESARSHAAAAASSGADEVRGVEFVDAASVHWRVTERDARGDPGARGDCCLIFACGDAVRRVWNYPPGWRDLSAAALIALSWRR
jgi:hypothetical protein